MSEFKELSRCLASSAEGRLTFFCNGCDMPHSISVGEGQGPRWTYNGNADSPTFTPSVLVSWTERDQPKVCHSFVTDGRIQYLSDCTHSLAGQVVDLPDWGSSWARW